MTKRKNKKQIENQKKKLGLMIDYLVDSYYLNPKKKFTIQEILKKNKINNCYLIEELIYYLRKEKFIKYNKDKFVITFNGFIYLESMQQKSKEYQNNLIGIIIGFIAFITTLETIILDIANLVYDIDKKTIVLFNTGIIVIMVAIVIYYINEVLKKY